MSFEKDALLHEIQDKLDSFYKNNIVIPLYWKEMNGRKIYDIEFMQEMFNTRSEQLQEEHSKEDCYACATQRHTCNHDNWEESQEDYYNKRDFGDYQCGNDEAPRKEEGEK